MLYIIFKSLEIIIANYIYLLKVDLISVNIN
jgi:hypothetical protein